MPAPKAESQTTCRPVTCIAGRQVQWRDALELRAFRDRRRPRPALGGARRFYGGTVHPPGLRGRRERLHRPRPGSRGGGPLGGLAGPAARLVGGSKRGPRGGGGGGGGGW